MLRGVVTEIAILGGTSNISQFFKYNFYDWVMFRDKLIENPDKNTVVGRYLGAEIDVGPEMRANIMRVNGEVVHWST